jgi:hypothetical protein
MQWFTTVRLAAFLLSTVSVFCFAQSVTLDQIVARMQQARAADRGNNPPYVVTREYQLSPAGAPRPSSQVVAQVSYNPPAAKDYAIVKAEGNDRGESVVRKVLEHETSSTDRQSQSREIAPSNYDLTLLGRESMNGRDCYVLQLAPKRQEVELIRGKAWVDARDFRLRRIDGEMAKSPSMWIKQVHVTMDFGLVNGIWLETASRAVADVRMAGTHVLTSRELDVQTASVSAKLGQPHQSQRERRHIVADTAAWVAH